MATKQTTTTTQTTMQAPTTTKTITEGTTTTQNIAEGTTTTRTTTQQCTPCTPPSPETAPRIIDTILADVNVIIPNFSSLVSSYRLLVGAAEEIHRIPGVCPDVFERAVRRFDNAGTLIDILLDLLCCKIAYSSEFLSLVCAPIDLFRLFLNRFEPCDQSHLTADEIITLETLRRTLDDCLVQYTCFSNRPVVCPTPPPPTPPPPPPQASTISASRAPANETNREEQLKSADNTPQPQREQPGTDAYSDTTSNKNSIRIELKDQDKTAQQIDIKTSNTTEDNNKITSPVRRRHI